MTVPDTVDLRQQIDVSVTSRFDETCRRIAPTMRRTLSHGDPGV
jgi:hypothetical protein